MFLVILWGAALSFLIGNAAWSYFGIGDTNGSAPVATFNPPANVTASFLNPGQRTVTSPGVPRSNPRRIVLDGYYVTGISDRPQPGLRDLADRLDDVAHMPGHQFDLEFVHILGYRGLQIVVLRRHQHKRGCSGTCSDVPRPRCDHADARRGTKYLRRDRRIRPVRRGLHRIQRRRMPEFHRTGK
jgi:hypothetical protein